MALGMPRIFLRDLVARYWPLLILSSTSLLYRHRAHNWYLSACLQTCAGMFACLLVCTVQREWKRGSRASDQVLLPACRRMHQGLSPHCTAVSWTAGARCHCFDPTPLCDPWHCCSRHDTAVGFKDVKSDSAEWTHMPLTLS